VSEYCEHAKLKCEHLPLFAQPNLDCFNCGRAYQAGKDERAVRKQLGDAPAHVNSDVDHGLKLAIAALDEAGKEE
jgi:hypothetical protein